MPYSIQTLDIFTDIPQHTVMCLCQDRSCIPQHNTVMCLCQDRSCIPQHTVMCLCQDRSRIPQPSYVSLSRQELYASTQLCVFVKTGAVYLNT